MVRALKPVAHSAWRLLRRLACCFFDRFSILDESYSAKVVRDEAHVNVAHESGVARQQHHAVPAAGGGGVEEHGAHEEETNKTLVIIDEEGRR